jgi:hypothetical protein
MDSEKKIAEYHSMTGVKLDRTMLAIVEVLVHENKIVFEKALEDIKTSFKENNNVTINFKSSKEAFLFSIGKKLWLVTTIICLTTLSLVWYFFVSENYRNREAEIENLSREKRVGYETFKGIINVSTKYNRITKYQIPGTNQIFPALQIPIELENQFYSPGLSYYKDSKYIYIRLE